MEKRCHPVTQVRIYEPGQQHHHEDGGVGYYMTAETIARDERTTFSPIHPAALGLWGTNAPHNTMPGVMHLRKEGISTLLCRPFADTTQSIGLGHFQPLGGSWRALHGTGLDREVKLYQQDGRSNLFSGLASRFILPPDPLFACSLYRAEPAPDHDWSHPPYTQIRIGVGSGSELMIVIPYGSPMFVMRREDGQWRKTVTDQSVRLPTLEGTARGQRVFLWFGVIGGRAVLSTDGFTEDICLLDDGDGDMHIPQGGIELRHNAGQIMFSFLPIRMAPATIWSPVLGTGYDTSVCNAEVFIESRTMAACGIDEAPARDVEVSDDRHERHADGHEFLSWKAEFTPNLHFQPAVGTDPDSGESVNFLTCTSPQLLAVQVGQWPRTSETSGGAGDDISAHTLAVRGRDGQRGGGRYEVVVDNQLGRFEDVREYVRADIAVGWEHSDGTHELTDVFSGHVVEPPRTVLSGGRAESRLHLTDPLIRLRDEKADGREPVFDGWPVDRVFQWVLGRCGFSATQIDIEDTGTVLTSGSPEQPIWQVEPGRPWLDFLEEVTRFDYNAGFFINAHGVFVNACRHCREKRTAANILDHDGSLSGACPSTVAWELFTRPPVCPPESDGLEITRLTRVNKSLGTSDFANCIVVEGLDSRGRVIRTEMCDTASISDPASERYVGWRKTELWRVPGYTSQDTVNRLALERFAELSPQPERVRVTTPLEPGLQVGQVVRIHGGEAAGVSGRVYRLQSVQHHVLRTRRNLATTTVEGRLVEAH